MTFREECKPYFDGPIFKRVPEDETFDGNGILYTGIYFNKLNSCGELVRPPDDDYDRNRLCDLYGKCYVKPGLINRGHDNLSVQKHDDYIGFCRAAQLLDARYAKQVIQYGREHLWFYKNVPGEVSTADWLSCWFARMPGVVQHFKICAGEDLTLFDRVWWAIGIIGTALSGDAGGFQMKHLMCAAYKEHATEAKYVICDLACFIFNMQLAKKWGSIENVYKHYFGAEHVFGRWGK